MTEEGNDITIESPTAPPPQITLQHLKQVLNIIQISSKRGTFNADELEIVGSTHRAIKEFVDYTITKSKPIESSESNVPDSNNDTKEV